MHSVTTISKINLFFKFFIIYSITFLIVNLIHMYFIEVNVLFYAVILDSIIALTISLLIFNNIYNNFFNNFEKIIIILLMLIYGYAFSISVPTVIDRSLSFYIIEKLEQRGGGIKYKYMENVFKDEYIKEHKLVDIRITEQINSGTIKIENECVKLTPKGASIARVSRFYRKHFLPKQRLIMDSYNDSLVDPFLLSADIDYYKC